MTLFPMARRPPKAQLPPRFQRTRSDLEFSARLHLGLTQTRELYRSSDGTIMHHIVYRADNLVVDPPRAQDMIQDHVDRTRLVQGMNELGI